MRTPRLKSFVLLASISGAMLLTACGSKPPVPDWEINAHGAARRATDAQLSGKTRVAEQEWNNARAEVSRTGSVERLARIELMRCAAQVASAQLQGCPAFDVLRADAPASEQAYADHLAGQTLDAARVALLPEAQRTALQNPAAIAQIADPLSRLVAIGVALKAGRATPDMLVLATDTASAQGWSHALLGWLSLRAKRAQELGDTALAQSIQRRIDLIEKQGRP